MEHIQHLYYICCTSWHLEIIKPTCFLHGTYMSHQFDISIYSVVTVITLARFSKYILNHFKSCSTLLSAVLPYSIVSYNAVPLKSSTVSSVSIRSKYICVLTHAMVAFFQSKDCQLPVVIFSKLAILSDWWRTSLLPSHLFLSTNILV